MKKALLILSFLLGLASAPALGAERYTASIVVTNQTTNGMTFVVNGDTRTWTNSVATPGTQILTNSAIGGVTTNLYNHIASYPFAGSLVLIWQATNEIRLIGPSGTALAVSATGPWCTITLSTQQVTSMVGVRVPISGEPTATQRTNIASELVSGIGTYASNSFAAGATALANHVNLTAAQTVSGAKVFSGATVLSNTSAKVELALLTNVTARILHIRDEDGAGNTNSGLHFWDVDNLAYSLISPGTDGHPGLYAVSGATATAASYAPEDASILNKKIAENAFGGLARANTWTGTNTFTRITNSTLVGSTYSGTVGTLSGGTWNNATLTNGVNRGNALQSYETEADSLQLGSSAKAQAPLSLAIGANAKVDAANGTGSIALGPNATNLYENAIALGLLAATTADQQIRIGTANEKISVPGGGSIGGNLFVGHEWGGFATGLARGLQLTNGTAASADPSNGALFVIVSGVPQYRTSASSEGSGQMNYLHNRASEVVGSGSDYTFTTNYARVDFGGQDPEISLPTAGTYLVACHVAIDIGTTVPLTADLTTVAQDKCQVKFYNSTASADITSSETSITLPSVVQKVITVAVASTIQLYGKNTAQARGTVKAIETRFVAVRLY